MYVYVKSWKQKGDLDKGGRDFKGVKRGREKKSCLIYMKGDGALFGCKEGTIIVRWGGWRGQWGKRKMQTQVQKATAELKTTQSFVCMTAYLPRPSHRPQWQLGLACWGPGKTGRLGGSRWNGSRREQNSKGAVAMGNWHPLCLPFKGLQKHSYSKDLTTNFRPQFWTFSKWLLEQWRKSKLLWVPFTDLGQSSQSRKLTIKQTTS